MPAVGGQAGPRLRERITGGFAHATLDEVSLAATNGYAGLGFRLQ